MFWTVESFLNDVVRYAWCPPALNVPQIHFRNLQVYISLLHWLSPWLLSFSWACSRLPYMSQRCEDNFLQTMLNFLRCNLRALEENNMLIRNLLLKFRFNLVSVGSPEAFAAYFAINLGCLHSALSSSSQEPETWCWLSLMPAYGGHHSSQ